MKRRYRFMRGLGCDVFTAGFIALLNELSNLPPRYVGFMHIIWDMETDDGR